MTSPNAWRGPDPPNSMIAQHSRLRRLWVVLWHRFYREIEPRWLARFREARS